MRCCWVASTYLAVAVACFVKVKMRLACQVIVIAANCTSCLVVVAYSVKFTVVRNLMEQR